MGIILLGIITGFAALGVGIWGICRKWETRYLYGIFIVLGIVNLLLTSIFIKLGGF